jgi:ligand-binding SRPBCC domain-containing protein
MIGGVFKMIVHDHHFEKSGDKTVMTDQFYYESPGGILGKLFNKIILTNYLRTLLQNRNKMIKEVAESEQWKIILNG